MASTYTPLGVELQATGENAGTWGNKTNVNLQVIEQIAGGFTQQALTSGGTVALTSTDAGTGDVLAHRVIEFTGSLSGNAVVTIPLDVQNFYLLRNSSSGAYTVQFKYTSGSGSSVTFSTTDKGDIYQGQGPQPRVNYPLILHQQQQEKLLQWQSYSDKRSKLWQHQI
jgi:hypothetical protein